MELLYIVYDADDDELWVARVVVEGAGLHL